jgi:hypothetical protein
VTKLEEVKDPDLGSGGCAEEDLSGSFTCSKASRPGRACSK